MPIQGRQACIGQAGGHQSALVQVGLKTARRRFGFAAFDRPHVDRN
jgi:hypothetical protein